MHIEINTRERGSGLWEAVVEVNGNLDIVAVGPTEEDVLANATRELAESYE